MPKKTSQSCIRPAIRTKPWGKVRSALGEVG